MKMSDDTISLSEALHELIRFRRLSDVPHGVQAQAAGLDKQTLRRLLNGQLDDPQLKTLRLLAAYYRISLEYFGLTTRSDVEQYLNTIRVDETRQLIDTLETQLSALGPKASQNVRALIERLELVRR